MESATIWGMAPLNFQALLGVGCFLGAVVIAKAINMILAGRIAGGQGILIYLRMVLGFLLTGALCFFFGALMGVQFL